MYICFSDFVKSILVSLSAIDICTCFVCARNLIGHLNLLFYCPTWSACARPLVSLDLSYLSHCMTFYRHRVRDGENKRESGAHCYRKFSLLSLSDCYITYALQRFAKYKIQMLIKIRFVCKSNTHTRAYVIAVSE